MAYTTDYSDIPDSSELIPAGDYECIIKYAGEDSTKRNTIFMGVTFVVRNDIDQPCKNKYIWHHIWQKKEPSPADLACSGYSSKQINAVSKAAKLPNGKSYDSLTDWADELKNKCVRVTVEHEEYQGKTNARVKWVNESKFPDCKHVWKTKDGEAEPASESTPAAKSDDFTEVSSMSDNDLPF